MAKTIYVAPLQPNSENESSEHTQIGFNTLSGVSSVVGGETWGYMTSHTNTNSRLLPTPTRPLSDPNVDLAPHSSPKRPRERPLGSKNKPKRFIPVIEETDSIWIPTVLQIPAGNDIIKCLINFAQHRNTHITVLGGSGPVSDVSLRHPVSRFSAFPIKGTFNMVTLSGTWVNPSCGTVPPQFITNPSCSSFAISFFGAQGHVFGGNVGGKVMSAGDVIVTVSLFDNPVFYKFTPVNRNYEEVEEDDGRYAADRVVEPENANNTVMQWNHFT